MGKLSINLFIIEKMPKIKIVVWKPRIVYVQRKNENPAFIILASIQIDREKKLRTEKNQSGNIEFKERTLIFSLRNLFLFRRVTKREMISTESHKFLCAFWLTWGFFLGQESFFPLPILWDSQIFYDKAFSFKKLSWQKTIS